MNKQALRAVWLGVEDCIVDMVNNGSTVTIDELQSRIAGAINNEEMELAVQVFNMLDDNNVDIGGLLDIIYTLWCEDYHWIDFATCRELDC